LATTSIITKARRTTGLCEEELKIRN